MVFSQDNRYRYTMDRTNNGDTQLTVLYNDKSSKKYKRKYYIYHNPVISVKVLYTFYQRINKCCQKKLENVSLHSATFVVINSFLYQHINFSS